MKARWRNEVGAYSLQRKGDTVRRVQDSLWWRRPIQRLKDQEQGWKAPAEPRALSPWLGQLSLLLRLMRRHAVLMTLGPCCLPATQWGGQEVSWHCPSHSITHPASHCPRKSPEPCMTDRTSLPRGCRPAPCLCASPNKPRPLLSI